ncbi:Protease inhibitor precursor [compost metagenome]
MRAVFEALGAQVSWNQTTRTATGQKGSTTASVTIDSFTAVQNGKEYRLEAAPRLINGYTMVPVRFIAESFGAKVEWDGPNAAVRISMP